MKTEHFAIGFLFFLVMAVVSNLVYLQVFASKGARFTAADGATERLERMSADADLNQRLIRLERAVSEIKAR
jgi:hypothetical protein